MRRAWSGSISVRVVAAITAVLVGYLVLSPHFAAFDAAVAAHGLGLLGFRVENPGAGDMSVQAGHSFQMYAVVTGSCSSAAGVLGLGAVSLLLLPGSLWRRLGGGMLAAVLFVLFNVARICSIVLLGWWMASTSPATVFNTLAVVGGVALAVAIAPHGRLFLRIGALLAAGLCAVLAYDVHAGYDYLDGMASYHALAGPVLTFGALSIGVLVIWWVLVGRPERRSAQQPATG
jgi:hypothetical protein